MDCQPMGIKGNNSCKSRSNVTEVRRDLYYVKTNSYTISQKQERKVRKTQFLPRALTQVKMLVLVKHDKSRTT